MCLTTLTLFTGLMLIDLYYFSFRIVKIERRSFHVVMFVLIMLACLSVQVSCWSKLSLLRQYDAAGSDEALSEATMLTYLIAYEFFLVFNNMVHTLFITKYWLISMKVKQLRDM